jgi:replicative superfamily II helicase
MTQDKENISVANILESMSRDELYEVFNNAFQMTDIGPLQRKYFNELFEFQHLIKKLRKQLNDDNFYITYLTSKMFRLIPNDKKEMLLEELKKDFDGDK